MGWELQVNLGDSSVGLGMSLCFKRRFPDEKLVAQHTE